MLDKGSAAELHPQLGGYLPTWELSPAYKVDIGGPPQKKVDPGTMWVAYIQSNMFVDDIILDCRSLDTPVPKPSAVGPSACLLPSRFCY